MALRYVTWINRASPFPALIRGFPMGTESFGFLSGRTQEAIVSMMTKKSVDAYVSRRPFQAFEVRMVDGQRFRFTSIEQFIVGRDDIAALTKTGVIIHFSLGLIATIRPIVPRRRRA